MTDTKPSRYKAQNPENNHIVYQEKLVDLLSNYFQKRSSFLAQVIRADLINSKYLPKQKQLPKKLINSLGQEPKNGNGSHIKYENIESINININSNGYGDSYLEKYSNVANVNQINSRVDNSPAKLILDTKTKPIGKERLNVEELLINLIVEQTGYPRETISGELRLLDDLNLDSIKAGELVASAAQQVSVAGELDPSTLANATIAEVAKTIESLTSTEPKMDSDIASSDTKIDLVQLLLDLIELNTGFPQDTLSAELRLLDDLNLDSIKAGELVAAAAQQVGVSGELDPSQFANATIAEIAKTLEEALDSGKPQLTTTQAKPKVIKPITAAPIPEEASWVRNFKVDYIAQEKTTSVLENWSLAKVLILCDRVDSSLVTNLAAELKKQKAKVDIFTYQDIEQNLAGYTHYLAFLPEEVDNEESMSLDLMTTRLRSIATAPKNSHVAYLQFGGGFFGTKGQDINPEACNAAAFARSLHLERDDLKVTVIDLDFQIEPTKVTELILKELTGSEPITTVGYDAKLTRWIPQSQILQPIDYQPRSHSWSGDDVILVTGGAKGITAECALAIAKATGAKMALVGRSSKIAGEIAQTLERFNEQELICKYYACDITDKTAVQGLVTQVNFEIGNITGIIHGAGLNTPRRIEQVTLESARTESAPKLLGAFNLLQALDEQPIKIFAAFSSIIGVTGMPGNSWYAFANESLSLMLNRWQQQHPESDVISLAYSVWSEVGMGARMGSIKNLARMGIGAIKPNEGIERFVDLFKGNPGVNQVIITARLGGLDTWYPPEIVLDKQLRFIEEVEYLEPGVETRVKAHLTLERDRYVGDHIWRGSYLFPTVFGLEAMAQATAYVLGESQPEIVRIEEISLRRPVVVSPEKGTQIQIRAEVFEKDQQGEIKVKTSISSEQSNFSTVCFSAVLVVGKRTKAEKSLVKPGRALDIDPKIDLYGGLLFQGELFQRLEKVYYLSRDLSILGVATRSSNELELTNEGFGEGLGGHLILGDPYFRDVLLQSMQVNIPQDICLPVQIDCIELNYDPSLEEGERTLQAILHQREGQEYLCEVIATDSEGVIRERIRGYHLRILEEHPENPSAQELARPEQRDRAILKEAIAQSCKELSLISPSLELGYIPGLGSQEQKQRRKQERPLIASALAHQLDKSPKEISFKLKTLASGKPKLIVKEYPGIELSLSHDERYCLCTVGNKPQGCDIEVIRDRSREDWQALLSNKHSAVLEALIAQGDEQNIAGTRIWSANEAVRKAFNGSNPEFSVVKLRGTTALLEANTETGKHLVLTINVNLTRLPERIVAFLVQPQGIPTKVKTPAFDISQIDLANATLEETVKAIIQPHHHLVDVTDDGPQDQKVYRQRFQVSFRQACSISRQVPVSQYISWVGKFRETPMVSMAEPMLRDFYSGEYGMVTNQVTLKILGDATTYDTIQGRCWMGNLKDSSFDTYIEFCKVLPDHSLERVAMAEVKATWVKLLQYGVPTPDPLPDYLANYLGHFTVAQPASIDLKNAPTQTLPQLPAVLANIDPGAVLYQVTPSPIRNDLLFSNAYQTTLEEANSVGNVYYGNYFIWQGRTLDLFFYQFIPEYFRVEQAQGEVLPLYSRMTYAREGMPFDKIRVDLYVDKVTEYGAVFHFRFFRENLDGSREKLHNGEQEVVWAVRNEAGNPVPAPWPKPVLEALLQHSKANYSLASQKNSR